MLTLSRASPDPLFVEFQLSHHKTLQVAIERREWLYDFPLRGNRVGLEDHKREGFFLEVFYFRVGLDPDNTSGASRLPPPPPRLCSLRPAGGLSRS